MEIDTPAAAEPSFDEGPVVSSPTAPPGRTRRSTGLALRAVGAFSRLFPRRGRRMRDDVSLG